MRRTEAPKVDRRRPQYGTEYSSLAKEGWIRSMRILEVPGARPASSITRMPARGGGDGELMTEDASANI